MLWITSDGGPTFGHHLYELQSFSHHWHNSLVLLTRVISENYCIYHQNVIFMNFRYNCKVQNGATVMFSDFMR